MKNNTWKIILSLVISPRKFFIDQIKIFSNCKYKYRWSLELKVRLHYRKGPKNFT